MDWWLILLRIVLIGSAMIWFGGAPIPSFFLAPTAAAPAVSAQRDSLRASHPDVDHE